MLMGIGGAPEGVISAAALRCMGGDMQGKLRYRNDAERERARAMGIDDGEKIFRIDEMARGDVMFAVHRGHQRGLPEGGPVHRRRGAHPLGGDAQPDRDGALHRDRAPFPAEAQLRLVARETESAMASKVSKEMVVDVPVEAFWKVIADYAAYPDFVPGVKRCRVVHEDKGVKDVEYEVDLGVKTIKYVLRHLEHAPARR